MATVPVALKSLNSSSSESEEFSSSSSHGQRGTTSTAAGVRRSRTRSESSASASYAPDSNLNPNNVPHISFEQPPEPTGFYDRHVAPNLNKGNFSNLVTFLTMLLGILIVSYTEPKWAPVADGVKRSFGNGLGLFIYNFGLFGFAGGITNWLAIKMLFDDVCGLPGSGVIPKRFREIRETVKNTIMFTFFDPEFLEKYIQRKTGQLTASINFEEKIKAMLESPAVDQIIDAKLAELGNRPEGLYLAMMDIDTATLKPMIKPFVLGMGSDIAPLLLETFDPSKMMSIDTFRNELDALMTDKLQELTPERVKKLMEDVIRHHLGWLIVWGNIFGGTIGIVSHLFTIIAN